MTLTKTQSDNLKWFAIILMVIDHVGLMFFPEQLQWRMIGRLAFPLFAFQLAIGYQYTRNHGYQLKNLFIFALISQIPFLIATEPETWKFNIFFTLMIGYLLILSWEKKQWIGFIALLIGAFFIPMDYGIYGASLPFLFYIFRKKPFLQSIAFIFSTLLDVFLVSPYQIFAIFSIFVLFLIPKWNMVPFQTSKWFFYLFYPIHLTLLVSVKMFID